MKKPMTHAEKDAPNSLKGWTKSFAGRWQDDRSSEEIISDIRAARTTRHFDIEL